MNSLARRTDAPRRASQPTPPVFTVNPQIIVTMNDEMAAELIKFIEAAPSGTIPPSVWSFKCQLQKDMQG